jgi:hypothetical protein
MIKKSLKSKTSKSHTWAPLSQNSEAFEAQNGPMEGRGRSQWRRKMEPCRVCRPVVADSYHEVGSGSGAGTA